MAGLKDILKKKLTKKELSKLRASFDIVGSIAIIEIPDDLIKKEKIIASELLKQNSSVKTVFKKIGRHTGFYRTQKLKFLAGVYNKEAVHKENGVLIKLNVEKCYFSPRLSAERIRIAKQVKKNESVLVMFSGVGPYPLVVAKHSSAKFIVGIEKNPVAHKYALENILINKITADKIVLYCADVSKKVPFLKQKFDRIIMPLPKTGGQFLDVALNVIKKNGVIHLYQFVEENAFDYVAEKIVLLCKKSKRLCNISGIYKAGQHAPRNYRVCFDINVIK